MITGVWVGVKIKTALRRPMPVLVLDVVAALASAVLDVVRVAPSVPAGHYPCDHIEQYRR